MSLFKRNKFFYYSKFLLIILFISIIMITLICLSVFYFNRNKDLNRILVLRKIVDSHSVSIINRMKICKTSIPYSLQFWECSYSIIKIKDKLTDKEYKKEIRKINLKAKVYNDKYKSNIGKLNEEEFNRLIKPYIVLYTENDILYVFRKSDNMKYNMYLFERWKKVNDKWYYFDYNPLIWKKRILYCKEVNILELKCIIDKNDRMIDCKSKSCITTRRYFW